MEMSEATILALECETIITEWLEHQASTMDFLETKEEEEDSQGLDMTAMGWTSSQTSLMSRWSGGAEIITGAGVRSTYTLSWLAGCNCKLETI